MIATDIVMNVFVGMGMALVVNSGEQRMGSESKSETQQRIYVETIVNADSADVWHAWTTNEGTQSFFTKRTNVKLAIGGPFEMLFLADAPKGSQGSEGCRFLSYLPGEMLSFSWSAPPQFEHARKHHTWVVVQLERADDKKTVVKLTHLGWGEMKANHPEHADEWEQVYQYFAAAWPRVLENLKNSFEKKQ